MAETVKVKGIQFNYAHFLWENLGYIRQQQREGNIVYALKLLITLMNYLPEDIQKKFIGKAANIDAELKKLMAEVKGTSILETHQAKQRVAKIFAEKMFPEFMGQIAIMLDRRKYMELTSTYEEGYSMEMLKKLKESQ